MKTLRLFSLLACMILCGLTASAQVKDFKNPDEADYFIKGKFNIKKNAQGKIEYTLTNVSTKGITFDMKDVFEGTLNDKTKEQILFEFENAQTDYNGGFENRTNRLQYWRKVAGIWQPDTETDQGGKDTTINNYLNIMLVLDCSNSLGGDFTSVKNGAEQFIERLYRVAPNGNIRVGIIGFSTINNADNHALEICPLTYSTKDKMINRINNFPQGNGTALYYSLDKAVEYLKEDSKNINEEDYLGSYIITFTDGIDQQSHDYDRDILTADVYYEKIRPVLQNENRTKIYGKDIEHTIIALRGKDIPDAMVKKFEGDLKALCDEYILLTNINELSSTFARKAEDLINKSTKLQCFVSMGFQGEVGWTFGKKELAPVVEYKPLVVKKPSKVFLGINAGIGASFGGSTVYEYGYYDYYHSYEAIYWDSFFALPFTVGVDFAYPLTDKFSLGAYTSFGFVRNFNMSFGALTMFDRYNNKALIAGAGINFDAYESAIGATARFGTKFRNNFYLFGEFLFNISWEQNLYGVLIHFGYNIGGLF